MTTKFIIKLFLFFCAWIASVSADYVYKPYHIGDIIGYACENAVESEATFCLATDLTCTCTNAAYLGTMLACGFENAKNTKEVEAYTKWFQSQCPGLSADTLNEIYQNATKYMVNDTSSIPGFNITVPINVPLRISEDVYYINYETSAIFDYNLNDGFYMGSGLTGYWAVIFLFSTIYRLLAYLGLTTILKKNIIIRFLRAKLFLPASFKKRHATSWVYGFVPTRWESFVIFGWFVLCVLFCSTRYHYFDPNTYFATKRIQMSRYVGDRAGYLSCYMVILTFLFGGRNNFLLWLTGWKFSTFVTYHKWVARMTVLVIVVHSIAYLDCIVASDYYSYYIKEGWYIWGCVATVVGSVMFMQAFSFLRHLSYEVFLYFHIVLAVFFLIGAWLHIKPMGLISFVYATAAIWCFDRLIRLVRMWVLFGGYKKTKISLISDETLVFEVPYNPTIFRANPGSFSYVYFASYKIFWQSHPFTMVPYPERKTLKFYVKVKAGLTKILYKDLIKTPHREKEIRVCVEGPYGSYHNLTKYDHVLMYSGGNGIPGPFAYSKKLCEDKNFKGFIKLYWVIRNWSSLHWFLEELKSLAPYEDKLQLIVYISKFKDYNFGDMKEVSSDSSSSKNEDKEFNKEVIMEKESTNSENDAVKTITEQLPYCEFRKGRPDIEQVVVDDLNETGSGSVAVVTCGHSNMCDDIRYKVSEEVYNRSNPIELIEELQGW